MSIAFVFPGQGSQSVGMLAELISSESVVADTFAEASGVLSFDAAEMAVHGPESELNQTHNTQPLLLTAGVAMWRLWRQNNDATVTMMAGHSLGEYTALVCSGALSFTDAVSLVRDRGRFMQQAVAPGVGAMAAIIGMEDEQIVEICASVAGDDVVSAANFNSPGQVVIAGHASAVERAITALQEAGAKRAVPLPVSVPSHCALMRPAADSLAERLDGITIDPTDISVIHNVDAEPATGPEAVKDMLVRQLYQPVRWVDCVKQLQQRGAERLIECGPGKVLSGLVRRIDRNLPIQAINDRASLDKALDTVGES